MLAVLLLPSLNANVPAWVSVPNVAVPPCTARLAVAPITVKVPLGVILFVFNPAKVGVAPSTISDFLSGYRTPSLATAGRIAAATKGKVPVSAWLKSPRA